MSTDLTIVPKTQFVQNVQKWVMVDMQLKKINEKTKELREHRKNLSESICQFIQTNHLEETKIEISNGEIKTVDKRDYAPLTFIYIEKTLGQIIKDKSQIDFIIKMLKENREITTHKELCRTETNK